MKLAGLNFISHGILKVPPQSWGDALKAPAYTKNGPNGKCEFIFQQQTYKKNFSIKRFYNGRVFYNITEVAVNNAKRYKKLTDILKIIEKFSLFILKYYSKLKRIRPQSIIYGIHCSIVYSKSIL